jgi:hypothetical protein
MAIGIHQARHNGLVPGIQDSASFESPAYLFPGTDRSDLLAIHGHRTIVDETMLGVHGHYDAPFDDEIYTLSVHRHSPTPR